MGLKPKAQHNHLCISTMRWLRNCFQRLAQAWIPVQVEFHGHYSFGRVLRLGNYVQTLSYSRMIVVCLVTPLLCLILSVLNDLAPLTAPERGVGANWVFWIRFWTTACLVDGIAVLQIGHYVPRLKMKMHQVIVIGALAATVAFVVTYAVAAATIFPLPFSTLVASPPAAVVIFSCFVFYWGAQLKSDAVLRREVAQQIAAFMCEMSLTFVYPIYIYGFMSLSGTSQAWFTFVLVIIKLISKNVMSRILEDQHDINIKPAFVVFNVEVFNALYISSALQSASSLSSVATVIMVNVLQFWLSMYDIFQITSEINGLMNTIPHGHLARKQHFLQVALDLLERGSSTASRDDARVTNMQNYKITEERIKTRALDNTQAPSKMDLAPPKSIIKRVLKQKRFVSLSRIEISHGSKIFVFSGSRLNTAKTMEIAAEASNIFSQKDRFRFLGMTARLLFITEYIILVKYTAVILPIIYSLHNAILFKLPNRDYYPDLAEISSDEPMISAKCKQPRESTATAPSRLADRARMRAGARVKYLLSTSRQERPSSTTRAPTHYRPRHC